MCLLYDDIIIHHYCNEVCAHNTSLTSPTFFFIEVAILINVRENRRDNHEWTIQRHSQHRVHETQDEDKQNKKTQQKKLKGWTRKVSGHVDGQRK